MLAHGFRAELLDQLVIDGLARAEHGILLGGQRQLMVRWMEITDLGHAAFSDAPSDPCASAAH
jgi:hypothetical protein